MDNQLRFMITLPAELVGPGMHEPEIAHEMVVLWFLHEIRAGRLSAGRVAEALHCSTAEVIEQMHVHGLPYPNYSAESLGRELGPL